jgi:hypothetical protein
MTAQHTPGPWWVDIDVCVAAGSGVDYLTVAEIVDANTKPGEAEANARLIAAAPELLQAAKNALADIEGILPEFEPSGDREHPAWQTIEELKAAILRAEGGQHE